MPSVVVRDGLMLSYETRGAPDGPAVLLLPGPTDSWRSYEPILDSMSNDLRVVAVSMRGHGDSSKPRSGYRIEDLASDVVPLLDALDIGQAVLVGHSGSCLVARRVAIDCPDRVAGLFLEASPSTLRDNESLADFVETVVGDLSEPINPEVVRSFVLDTSTDALPVDLIDPLIEDVLKVPVVAWKEMFASLCEYDDTAELARISAPTMLVWGDADHLVPRGMQDVLLDLLPSCELAVYEGVAHTPRWERPQRFAADLAAFASPLLS